MSNTQEKKRTSRSLRRFVLRMTGVVVVCILIVYLVLVSGIIESQVIPFVSDRILGARLNLHIDSLWPLQVRDIQVQQGATAPVLKTKSVAVSFKQAPSSFLPVIESIAILHPQLHIDAKEQSQSNYAFLHPFLESSKPENATSRSNPSRWLPQRVTIDEIDIKVDMPEWSAAISNVNLATEIEGLNQLTAHVSGDAVLAGWQSGHDWLDIPLPQGSVDVNVAMVENDVDVEASILLPDFITLNGTAVMKLQPIFQMDISLGAKMDAPVFGELISRFSPVQVDYDTFKFSLGNLNMYLADNVPIIRKGDCWIEIENLLLGTPDIPWYKGNLTIRLGKIKQRTPSSIVKWSLESFREQKVPDANYYKGTDIRVTGLLDTKGSGIEIGAGIRDWDREILCLLWPKWEKWLPNIKNINIHSGITVAYNEYNVDFKGGMSTSLPSGKNAAFTGSGNYQLTGQTFSIKGEGTIGDGTYTFGGDKQDQFSTELSVDNVAASDVLSCLPWEALRPIKGYVTGKATLSVEESSNYAFQISADAASPAYDTWMLPETLGVLGLECKGSLTSDFSTINAKGTLELPESANVNVKSFLYDIDTSRITTEFDGMVALTTIAGAYGYDDLWGDVAASGKFSLINWQQISISPFLLVSDSLGYGDYSLPYGEELRIESPVQLDMTDYSISAGPSVATLGEGSRITTDVVHINADHTVDAASISLESDFSLLVAKQFLDEAEGQLTITVEDFHYGADAIAGNITYDCNAAHLVLPEKLADIHGLMATGSATLPPNPDSIGQLQIEELVVGGSKLQKTKGNILLEEQGIILDNVNFELFGGGVVARASVDVIGTELSASVSGEVHDLDLSIFTSEFEPPSLVLTGRVNGTFKAEFTTQQLRDLDVDFIASDDFSMNRDMVEQLLMSQYVDEMTGGRQMTKVLQSVIGKDEQRKFDGARLVLGLENERITGYAKLESEQLNLTVDIKADPPALLEALKTRQQ